MKKTEGTLPDCFDEEEDPIPKRQYQGLPVLSDTRWLTRVDSINCLLQHYRAVCEAVESVRDSSTGQSASDADSFLKRLLSFEFLASAVICATFAYTRPLTVALQAKDCDLLKAHRMAQRLVKTLEIERSGADKFNVLWQRTSCRVEEHQHQLAHQCSPNIIGVWKWGICGLMGGAFMT